TGASGSLPAIDDDHETDALPTIVRAPEDDEFTQPPTLPRATPQQRPHAAPAPRPASRPSHEQIGPPVSPRVPAPSHVGPPPPSAPNPAEVVPPGMLEEQQSNGLWVTNFHFRRSRTYAFVVDAAGRPIEIGSGRYARVFLGQERWQESLTDLQRL